jgi:thiamine biosynthesis protein ThiS
MQVVVNGDSRQLQLAAATVAGLLEALELPRTRVAVELNGAVVPKADHETHAVSDGDVVEIVTLVGGG